MQTRSKSVLLQGRAGGWTCPTNTEQETVAAFYGSRLEAVSIELDGTAVDRALSGLFEPSAAHIALR